jgi:hypothetical protein
MPTITSLPACEQQLTDEQRRNLGARHVAGNLRSRIEQGWRSTFVLSEEDARSRLEILSSTCRTARHRRDLADTAKARFSGKYLVVRIDASSRYEGHARFRGEDPGFCGEGEPRNTFRQAAKYLDPRTPRTAASS